MHLDGQQPHILVINDQPDILLLKQEILEDEGFRVTMRIIGDIALDEVAGLSPSLIIIGYSTQAELALLRDMASEPSLGRIPIVMCTGAVREVDAIRPELDAKGIAVVYKPFDIDHLVDIVRRQLGLAATSEGPFPPLLG